MDILEFIVSLLYIAPIYMLMYWAYNICTSRPHGRRASQEGGVVSHPSDTVRPLVVHMLQKIDCVFGSSISEDQNVRQLLDHCVSGP